MVKKNRKREKQIILVSLWLVATLFMACTVVIAYWNKVPSCIHIRVGEEEKVELNLPVSGVIYPAQNNQESAEEAIVASANTHQVVGIPVRFMDTLLFKANEVQRYQIDAKLFGFIPYKTIDIQVIENTRLTPAGIPIGIYVQTKGVMVVGIGNFEAEFGRIVEPAKYKLQNGDYILAVEGIPISGKKQFIELIEQSEGKEIKLGIQREEEYLEVAIKPEQTRSKQYRIGAWIRDNAQGIGTLTFVDEQGQFGALGHGINDMDTSLLMNLSSGSVYETQVLGIRKGLEGTPGEMSGYIAYDDEHKMGEICKNTKAGIFGICHEQTKEKLITESMPIALKQEMHTGEAQIICAVTGTPSYYNVEITDLHMDSDSVNRGIVLQVTDDALLELTGGIVQGMSGSPIIQDGKIIGAVTHVFVNDPTRGYGIFIEEMLGE